MQDWPCSHWAPCLQGFLNHLGHRTASALDRCPMKKEKERKASLQYFTTHLKPYRRFQGLTGPEPFSSRGPRQIQMAHGVRCRQVSWGVSRIKGLSSVSLFSSVKCSKVHLCSQIPRSPVGAWKNPCETHTILVFHLPFVLLFGIPTCNVISSTLGLAVPFLVCKITCILWRLWQIHKNALMFEVENNKPFENCSLLCQLGSKPHSSLSLSAILL